MIFEQQRLQGSENVSHEVIWRDILAEVAASRKAPRNEEFHKGAIVAGVQCMRRGSGRRLEQRGSRRPNYIGLCGL